MMKKFFITILICMQLFLLVNCQGSSLNNSSAYAKKGSNQGIVNAVFYKDGVYTGEGDVKSYGNDAASITITKGRISEVTYKRLDTSGNELLSSCCTKISLGNTRQKLLIDDIESNVELLTNEVMKRQSYDISIPTKNKELLLNWKLAVKRAIEKAKK